MIVFIVPAYNEEKNLPALLEHVHSEMKKEGNAYRVLVVNDGSTDDTLKVVGALKGTIPVDVYSHYPNRGVGETFNTGFQKALLYYPRADFIVTIEADNTSDLSILNQLISKIREGSDVALASCYAKEGSVKGTSVLRTVLSKGANTLLRALFPFKNIRTYSSFYRVYHPTALKKLHAIYGNRLIERKGFECMVEVLIKVARRKEMKIVEVPMVLDGQRRIGRSKMRVLKTIMGYVKLIFKEGALHS